METASFFCGREKVRGKKDIVDSPTIASPSVAFREGGVQGMRPNHCKLSAPFRAFSMANCNTRLDSIFAAVENRPLHRSFLSITLMCLLFAVTTNAQSIIEGFVMDAANNEMLIGVDVTVLGTDNVVKTNIDGRFLIAVDLDVSTTLVIYIKGYQRRSIVIVEPGVIHVELDRIFSQGRRSVEMTTLEKGEILHTSWSIDAVSGQELFELPNGARLSGLVNYSPIFGVRTGHRMSMLTMRGFAMSEVGRIVHLVDGTDISVPDLGGALELLTTPSEIDVSGVELLTGPSSSLHGNGAYAGALGYRTKNAWQQRGLTIALRGASGSELDAQVRFAYPFGKNKRFALKIVGQLSRVDDEFGDHFALNNYGRTEQTVNPMAVISDSDNPYGFSYGERQLLGRYANWVNSGAGNAALAPYNLKHNGYLEEKIAEPEARSIKLNGGLYYNLSDRVLLSYDYRVGYGSGIYQAEERFQLHNFLWQQHRLKAAGHNWQVTAYGNFTHSGNSFQLRNSAEELTRLGGLVSVRKYLVGYVDSLETLSNGFTTNVNDSLVELANLYGLTQGNSGWYVPGTNRFDNTADKVQNTRDGQSAAPLNLRSSVQQIQAKYLFDLKWLNVLLSAHAKREHPGSEGLFYSDTSAGLTFMEFGGLTKFSAHLFKDKLVLTAGLRVDKSELFNAQLSPRFALNYTFNAHSLRAGYQTGYRNPSYWDLFRNSKGTGAWQLGNSSGYEHIFTESDVSYISDIIDLALRDNVWPDHCPEGDVACLHQWLADSISSVDLQRVTPERVSSVELGYRGVLFKNLYLDVAGHYSLHSNRIYYARSAVLTKDRTAEGVAAVEQLSPDSLNYVLVTTAINASTTAVSTGLSFNLTYHFSDRIWVNTNYTFSKLLTDDHESLTTAGFNIPQHRYNMGLRFRKIWKGFGFSINYQWSEGYTWSSRMGTAEIPNQSILDAQISYEIPKLYTTLRIEGSNIMNDPYRTIVGGPGFRSSLYASILFDLSVR